MVTEYIDDLKAQQEMDFYHESQADRGYEVRLRASTPHKYTEALSLPTEGTVPEDRFWPESAQGTSKPIVPGRLQRVGAGCDSVVGACPVPIISRPATVEVCSLEQGVNVPSPLL